MKTRAIWWLLVCALCLGVKVAAGGSSNISIVGTWNGTDDKGTQGGFMFTADGNADMLRDGQSFKATVMKGEGKMTYRIDRNVTPMALDLTATFANGKSNTMLFIIEFTNEDTMRMRMTPVGSPRAKNFNGATPDEIIVLHRRVEK